VLVEGEIDWMSTLTLGLSNVIGVQGIGNLRNLVKELADKNIKEIYLLVDADSQSDKSISSLLVSKQFVL
jgi:DNA primase